tara:strand:+ start:4499 stop:4723 length:225 start_codon:yes stop_codon:yes gene_type:complete
MDFDEEFELEHLIFKQRKCRVCGKIKDLVDGFYKTRKGSGPSSYSYECKECTKIRVLDSRKNKKIKNTWEYPDW